MTISNDLRFLSVTQVADRLSASKSTIWRWAKLRPDFPKAVKIGQGTTRWRSTDLDAFEASLGAAQ